MEIQEQLNKIQGDLEEIKKLLTRKRRARVEISWDELFPDD